MVTALRNLLAELWGDELDHDELIEVIQMHFGAAQDEPDGAIVYPGQGVVKMRLRAEGDRIRALEPGPDFDAGDLMAIRQKVDVALRRSTGTTTQRAVLFASRPVTGWYTAPDGVIGLRPAPPSAPRPKDGMLGKHPFLIEYRYRGSNDVFVGMQRSFRVGREWAWVLNSILTDAISVVSNRGRHHWVLVPSDEGDTMPVRVVWAQESYHIAEGLPPLGDDPSIPDGPPIPRRVTGAYYGDSALRVGTELDLPDSIDTTLTRLQALPQPERQRYLRAAQWLFVANELWDVQISSWYIGLVTAIEALAFTEDRPDPCPACGRDRSEAVTRRFKDFLERFAPGVGNRSVINELYRVRSSLVHGGDLLHHDDPYGMSFKPVALEERARMDRLSRAVKVAMINWLWSGPEARG
jgi:hypothetical protein